MGNESVTQARNSLLKEFEHATKASMAHSNPNVRLAAEMFDNLKEAALRPEYENAKNEIRELLKAKYLQTKKEETQEGETQEGETPGSQAPKPDEMQTNNAGARVYE